MVFENLFEAVCGRVNPIVQLAAHANPRNERQENFGRPSTTNQMMPNTFNVNELMDQINFESERSMFPLSRSPPSLTRVPLERPPPSLTRVMHNAPEEECEMFGNYSPRQDQFTYFPRNIVSHPNYMVPPPMFNRVNHEYYPQPEPGPILLDEEEWQRLQEELAESQETSETLENNKEIVEENSMDSQSENFDNTLEHPSYLVYKNLSVEDVYGINDLGKYFNETENFYNFVENYVLKNSTSKYQKYRPIERTCTCISVLHNKDSKIKTPRLLESNEHSRLYTIPSQDKLRSGDFLQDLAEDLAMNEQYSNTIETVQFNSSNFTCDHNNYVFLLTNAYLHEHCFYQAGQTLFTWLKSRPEYRDIIPPNFEMKDKTETTLDIEQHKALMKMFKRAAQRSPVNPDEKVQFALAKLCEISQDYEKSIDCFESICRNTSGCKDSMMMYLGNSLALANKPEYAIEIYRYLAIYKKHRIQALTNTGLLYLKTEQYYDSTSYFYGLIIELIGLGYTEEDATLENTWSRLRLCFELMNRGDLCEAVDNRDLSKIRKHLDTSPTFLDRCKNMKK